MFKNSYLFSSSKYRKNLKSYHRNCQPKLDVSLYVKKSQDNQHEEVYQPKHKFSDFAIHERIKMNIREKVAEIIYKLQATIEAIRR